MKVFLLNRERLNLLSERFIRALSSPKFFWLTVCLLFFQSGWIAISARYPGAFDEQYHYGIIKLFTSHITPIFGAQPAGNDQFGPLSHSSSLLYHYLMSFPLRLLLALHASMPVQIVTLRLINVILLCSALIPLRKALGMLRISHATVNVLLFFFVCIPVVSLLGSQISYDNLLIPLVAVVTLLTLQIISSFNSNGQIVYGKLALLILICMLASLVKFSFVPFFIAVFFIILTLLIRSRKLAIAQLKTFLRTVSRTRAVLFMTCFLVLGAMLLSTYGYNIVRYHTPLPDCSDVLSVSRCQAYSPWARNYSFAHMYPRPDHVHMIIYVGTWVKQSIRELVFTISSSFMADGTTVAYYAKEPLPVLLAAAWVLFIMGVVLVLLHLRQIMKDPLLKVLIYLNGFYLLVLFLQNFKDFLGTGQPVAIHGRYLLPVLPFLFVLAMRAFQMSLRLHPKVLIRNQQLIQAAATLAFIILISQGGGMLAYMVRSDDDWHQYGGPVVQHINRTTHDVLKHTIIGA